MNLKCWGWSTRYKSKIFAAQATGCCPVHYSYKKNGSENITPVKPNTNRQVYKLLEILQMDITGLKLQILVAVYGEDIS